MCPGSCGSCAGDAGGRSLRSGGREGRARCAEGAGSCALMLEIVNGVRRVLWVLGFILCVLFCILRGHGGRAPLAGGDGGRKGRVDMLWYGDVLYGTQYAGNLL